MRKYILIVDDEAITGKLISIHLISEGYDVEAVLTGEEAMRRIQREKPSLVLLDILLPGIDGIETLKRIRSFDSNIPVVMITGIHDNEEGKKAFAAGARDYVTKPIDFQYLKTILSIQSE